MRNTKLGGARGAAFVAGLLVSLVAPVVTAQGRTGPYAHVMDPPRGGTSFALSGIESATMTPFDPGDPRTGLGLAAAYAPSPLLLLDRLLPDAEVTYAFTVFELVVGLMGMVVSSWAFGDAILREQGADISIASIAAAHAFGWNLQLVIRAVLRMVLGDDDSPAFAAAMPTVFAFPVAGGAGVAPRWTF